MHLLDYSVSKTRYWSRLLPVSLGIILLEQAGSAKREIDTSVLPENLWIGNSVTVTAHVYDSDYAGVPISNGDVHINAVHIPAEHVGVNVVPPNASGWAVLAFTPAKTGKYSISPDARVTYSSNPELPPVGFQYTYGTPPWINISSKALHVTPVIRFVLAATTTATPTSTTPVPAVTTTQTPQQALPVTQVTQPTVVSPVTQAPPAPQTTSPVPVSQSDTIPPVTTLTFAGTQDSSGRYRSGVICTLAATDNAGGSGVSVTRYSFDGTNWNTYSQPFAITGTGPTVIYYRSSDNAGNTEGANVKAFAISGTAGAALAGTAATLQYGTPSVATASPGIGPFYPLPLWLVALIIFVLMAAIGGGLYLKSRLKEAEPKK